MDKTIKRNKLIQAGLTCFQEKGYHSTRIEDITNRAGTGKGTFYLYFKSKENLVLEVFHDMAKEIEQTLELAVEGIHADLDLKMIFEKQAVLLTETLSQNKLAASFILKEGRSVSAKLNEEIHHLIQDMVSQTVETFELAQSMNLISKTHPKIMAIQLIGGIMLTYELWLTDKLELSTDEIHKSILEYALTGLNLDQKRLGQLMQSFQ